MAPGFLSKLVRSPSPHGRERSISESRSRAQSQPSMPIPSSSTFSSKSSRAPSIRADNVSDSSSFTPNVTVLPPTPQLDANGILPSDGESNSNAEASKENGVATAVVDVVEPPPRPRSAASVHSVHDKTKTPPPVPPLPTKLNPSPQVLRHQGSNKSLNTQSPHTNGVSPSRSATTPHPSRPSEESADGPTSAVYDTMSPIVESPTTPHPPEYAPELSSSPPSTATVLPSPHRDSDAVSLASAAPSSTSPKENKQQRQRKKSTSRPWGRSKQPTGLASAIAASGLAMANPALSAPQAAQLSPPTSLKSAPTISSPPFFGSPTSASSMSSRKPSQSSQKRNKRSLTDSPKRRRTVSDSGEYHDDYQPEYYSGLEDDSSDDDDDDEDDEDGLLDLDLGEDMPVTGFAVANSRRNADFHDLFSNIPEGDYLIEDYGCALQREILIQGRLYISENHICFHANIFGWVTDLTIPINEINTLEKKSTALFIPNAIQVTTRHDKYTFASLLARDTTYDVIYNIWRLSRPGDTASIVSTGRGSVEKADSLDASLSGGAVTVISGTFGGEAVKAKLTKCACLKEGKHFSETALDTVFPGTPDRIYNLIFASGFIKDFLSVNQKLLSVQISDWAPIEPGSHLLGRNMTYIKPLNGAVGPKQTKCEIRDETLHCDFDDYVVTLTTTKTPDVPSGNVFLVKTRTCIMWATVASARVIVTSQVEWTGRSFIKGIIERSAVEGQKLYHNDLEKAMRAYIQEHQSEFLPAGIDLAAVVPAVVTELTSSGGVADSAAEAKAGGEQEDAKKRELERNARGLQWAWDTFEGASKVAKESTKGALELLKDAWDQSTTTTILYFVIVFLVFSNIWTFMRVGSREDAARRKEMRKLEDREKWIQGVVTALWDELSAGKGPAGMRAGQSTVSRGNEDQLSPGGKSVDWMQEIVSIEDTLGNLEERIRVAKESLMDVRAVATATDNKTNVEGDLD